MLLECVAPMYILQGMNMTIGQYIRDKRVLKGWTQGDLAAKTGISARTIQRIENGDVEPRAYSLQTIASALGVDLQELLDCQKASPESAGPKPEQFWLPVLHLSGLFILLVPPLLIWLWKRGEVAEIQKQGIDVLNFQLNMLVLLVPLGIFAVLLITIPFIILIGLYSTVVIIVNTIKVANHQSYRYPVMFRILRP